MRCWPCSQLHGLDHPFASDLTSALGGLDRQKTANSAVEQVRSISDRTSLFGDKTTKFYWWFSQATLQLRKVVVDRQN